MNNDEESTTLSGTKMCYKKYPIVFLLNFISNDFGLCLVIECKNRLSMTSVNHF